MYVVEGNGISQQNLIKTKNFHLFFILLVKNITQIPAARRRVDRLAADCGESSDEEQEKRLCEARETHSHPIHQQDESENTVVKNSKGEKK